MRKSKVFAYLRVSGKGQINGDGLVRQSTVIENYAKNNTLEIVKYFSDEGISGTLENRPALASMLIDLELNGVKTVIIEKVDRLARDLMIQEAIINEFRNKKLKLISVYEGENILSDDPTRKLVRQVLGAISEYDKKMTVLKLRAARERKKLEFGKCEGRKGYKEVLPEIIIEIKKLRRKPRKGKRKTFEEITQVLNQKGFRSISGKKFTGNNVSTLLHRSNTKK